uniref:Uncharacterized protein n=1 Tax=Arion vulgaris TaxID=1028688 RepID=A0A0B7BCF1_9EUPU
MHATHTHTHASNTCTTKNNKCVFILAHLKLHVRNETNNYYYYSQVEKRVADR